MTCKGPSLSTTFPCHMSFLSEHFGEADGVFIKPSITSQLLFSRDLWCMVCKITDSRCTVSYQSHAAPRRNNCCTTIKELRWRAQRSSREALLLSQTLLTLPPSHPPFFFNTITHHSSSDPGWALHMTQVLLNHLQRDTSSSHFTAPLQMQRYLFHYLRNQTGLTECLPPCLGVQRNPR